MRRQPMNPVIVLELDLITFRCSWRRQVTCEVDRVGVARGNVLTAWWKVDPHCHTFCYM